MSLMKSQKPFAHARGLACRMLPSRDSEGAVRAAGLFQQAHSCLQFKKLFESSLPRKF
jgi:hypothetical protein